MCWKSQLEIEHSYPHIKSRLFLPKNRNRFTKNVNSHLFVITPNIAVKTDNDPNRIIIVYLNPILSFEIPQKILPKALQTLVNEPTPAKKKSSWVTFSRANSLNDSRYYLPETR